MLWLKVVPFFNEQNEKGLFATQFTAQMEVELDTIENGIQSAPDVWHNFVDVFKKINEDAKTKKNSVASDKQIYRLKGYLRNMNTEERKQALNGKIPEEFTRPEMKETLDKMKDEGRELDYPPSKKQIAAILKMADNLNLTLNEALKIVDVDDMNELKGGMKGNASTLIGTLIEMSKKLPASEPQVKLILKEAESQGIPLSDILSIADIVSIEEMTREDASKIINAIVKKNKSKKKKFQKKK
jgi:hypothetical protein